VLVLIYLLVAWWFESFDVPLTIMAAIPFSLVGILPAHAAMGAFFTATSMIGFIAGAGTVPDDGDSPEGRPARREASGSVGSGRTVGCGHPVTVSQARTDHAAAGPGRTTSTGRRS
jgi:hypothetical protein